MNESAIIYGSNNGSTKKVAESISSELNGQLICIDDMNPTELNDVGFLIFATSTWGLGDLSDDWDVNIKKLDELNLKDKTVALVGLGDQYTYGSTFCDALSIIYDKIKDKGISLIGQWSTDDYEHDESKSILNDKFLGLIIDEDNEPEKTDERIKIWIDQIKDELPENMRKTS